MFILYCYDNRLSYWDIYRCENCYLDNYMRCNESYWLIPGTY